MQCFIGLTFSEDYLAYKKIDIYRRQFDGKYNKSNQLHMTLLSPFEIECLSDDFCDALSDDLESHFLGHHLIDNIEFNGFDLNSKRGQVYLRPELSLELQYCQQSLWDTVSEFGGVFKNKKRPFLSDELSRRVYLLIARTSSNFQFENAASAASLQFDKPFRLKSNGISLFESSLGQWPVRKRLFDFKSSFNSHEFSERECFEGQVQAHYV